MTELYWFTILGNLHVIIKAIMIISILFFAVLFIFYLLSFSEEDEVNFCNTIAKYFKISLVTLATSTALFIFIPSSTELYAIYGIGGTIDYLKENNEAKKLPDNIIKATNIFLEEMEIESSNP